MAVATVASAAWAATDSTYTRLDWNEDCEVIDAAPADEPASWVRLKCVGLGSYPIYVAEDDERISVRYGPVGDSRAWRSFQSFNRVSDTVEWRLEQANGGMRPFATIHRWFVSQPDGSERPVLVVSKVAQRHDGASCPVGYVDAGANASANTLARDVADSLARGFSCSDDEPSFHGNTDEHTPVPVAGG